MVRRATPETRTYSTLMTTINPYRTRTQTGSGHRRGSRGGSPFPALLGASSRPTSEPTRGGRAPWMSALRLRPGSRGGPATAAG